MKIHILISKSSWANKFRRDIKEKLSKFSNQISFSSHHRNIRPETDVNIIFSYFRIIPKEFLKRSKFNVVNHGSNLPKGRGMSPITWQILENKQYINYSLISASEDLDQGDIIFKKKIKISKNLLYDEIKKIELDTNLLLLSKFLKQISKNKKINFIKQKGKATYYMPRKPKDHAIDVNKSIKSQFNLLRTSDNDKYPCFFKLYGKKYLIKIENKSEN